jgi:hypothetical protein
VGCDIVDCELTLSGMRSFEAFMKFPGTPRQMSVLGEFSITTGEITAKTGNRGLADSYHFYCAFSSPHIVRCELTRGWPQ